MTHVRKVFASAVVSLAVFGIAQILRGQSASQNRAGEVIPVTAENFVRAPSLICILMASSRNGGFGKFRGAAFLIVPASR